MAVQTDKANLILTVNGQQATSTLKDLKSTARDLQRALNTLDPNSDEFKKLSAQLRDVNKEIGGITSQFREAKAASSGLSGFMSSFLGNFLGGGFLNVVQSVVGGIFNLGKSAVKASADMETLKTAVEVFLGSGAAAEKFLRDIQKFAAETPFEFPQLAEAGKKLLAFGYSGEEAMNLLKKLGDVSAATQVPIEELSSIIGKAKLGQKIQAEELNQLADRGINLMPQLAKVLHTTTDAVKALGSDGKISYADLEKAITMATEKGGQFYGMMAKQSQTFNGLISTLTDNFSQFVQSILGGIGDGLKPVIAGIADFFGQLTELIRDGKQPVGEYAEVIKYAAGVVKALGVVFGVLWEAGKIVLGLFLEQIKATAWLANGLADLVGWFSNLIQNAAKLPIIGVFFKSIADAIGLVKDLISNTSATFAGFRAAAQQAVTNVQNYFKALVIDAEILALKIGSALSFDKTVKDNAQKVITALENNKASMYAAGKTIEQAYIDGRNTAINAQKVVEKDNAVKKIAEQKAQAEFDAKSAEKAEKERLQRIQNARTLELEQTQLYYDRDLLANRVALGNGQRTESEAAEQSLLIQKAKYEGLLSIQQEYLQYFKVGTQDYIKTEMAILDLQEKLQPINKEFSDLAKRQATPAVSTLPGLNNTKGVNSQNGDNLRKIQQDADIEKSLVREKFGNLLSLEQEFNIKKLEIQSDAFNRQLKLMAENGQQETAQYKAIADQKKEIDKDITENKKKLAEIEKSIEESKQQIAMEAFDLGIQLLSTDENARKKHASAIKAFQVGQIVTNGVLEVQKIWAQVAEYGPAGPVIGAILTALAVGRAGAAIAKVQATKFAKGGMIQLLGGKSHAQGGTKGYFEDGTVVEMERGEALAVVNKQNTPLLRMFSAINGANGNGVPYFENGGLLLPNTTPNPANFFTPQYSGNSGNNNSSTSDMVLGVLIAKFDELKTSVEKNREVKLYRDKLQDATDSDTEDLSLVAWNV